MKDCFIVVRALDDNLDNIIPLAVFLHRSDAKLYLASEKIESLRNVFILESNFYENYVR